MKTKSGLSIAIINSLINFKAITQVNFYGWLQSIRQQYPGKTLGQLAVQLAAATMTEQSCKVAFDTAAIPPKLEYFRRLEALRALNAQQRRR